MKLKCHIVMRGIGDRKTPPPPVTQENIHVLSGQELQTFVLGQLQVQPHHVGSEALHPDHPAGKGLDGDAAGRPDFARFDDHIGQWPRTAEQRHAGELFGFGQGPALVGPVIEGTCNYLALAGATGSVPAAVREIAAMTQRRLEYGLIALDDEFMATRFDAHSEVHGFPGSAGGWQRRDTLSPKTPQSPSYARNQTAAPPSKSAGFATGSGQCNATPAAGMRSGSGRLLTIRARINVIAPGAMLATAEQIGKSEP